MFWCPHLRYQPVWVYALVLFGWYSRRGTSKLFKFYDMWCSNYARVLYDLIWQDQITDLDHSLIVIWLIFSPKELIVIWLIFLMIEWSRSDHFFEKTTPCFFQSFMKSKICFYIELILYINFNFILIYEIFFGKLKLKIKMKLSSTIRMKLKICFNWMFII